MPSNDSTGEFLMLAIKQVAERLRISLSLAYRLVANGEIPCHVIASCKRVCERDLRDYLDRQRVIDTRLPPGYRRHF